MTRAVNKRVLGRPGPDYQSKYVYFYFTHSMPRLISRLLKRLEDVPGSRKQSPEKPIRRKRIVSLHGPLVPPPSLSAVNRTQSILLDHVNPIINPDVYTRHKSLPPKVFHNTRQRVIADEVDQPRSMTNEELKWWSSPYCKYYLNFSMCSLSLNTLQCVCYPVQ